MMPPVPASPARVLARLFWRLWWLKAPGFTLCIWLFFQAYFFLLRYPHAEVVTMPLTWVDRAIPMQGWAWGPYLSLWGYACLSPALLPGVRQLLYGGLAVGGVCLVGLACFYFWPTVVPPFERPAGAGLALLEGVDAAGNACPSLHVAIAVHTAFWLQAQLCGVGAGRGWRTVSWAWCLLIVYATLATKQHVLVDVLAGAALGWVGALVTRAGYRRRFGDFTGALEASPVVRAAARTT
jgi:membrane-associated phospholipid phosphatase